MRIHKNRLSPERLKYDASRRGLERARSTDRAPRRDRIARSKRRRCATRASTMETAMEQPLANLARAQDELRNALAAEPRGAAERARRRRGGGGERAQGAPARARGESNGARARGERARAVGDEADAVRDGAAGDEGGAGRGAERGEGGARFDRARGRAMRRTTTTRDESRTIATTGRGRRTRERSDGLAIGDVKDVVRRGGAFGGRWKRGGRRARGGRRRDRGDGATRATAASGGEGATDERRGARRIHRRTNNARKKCEI